LAQRAHKLYAAYRAGQVSPRLEEMFFILLETALVHRVQGVAAKLEDLHLRVFGVEVHCADWTRAEILFKSEVQELGLVFLLSRLLTLGQIIYVSLNLLSHNAYLTP